MRDDANPGLTGADLRSPQPRRISAPRWLDVRLLIGVGLVLASVIAGARLVSSASKTRPVLAAARDLAAGTRLAGGDLVVVRVKLGREQAAVYLSRINEAVGSDLAQPLTAGELVPAAALAAVPAQTTLTVRLPGAAAPQLHRGQRIELWVSSPSCPATVLVPDVTVQAVRSGAGVSLGSITDGQDVVISLAPVLADRVIEVLGVDGVALLAGVLEGTPARGPPDRLPEVAACVEGGP